jgi:hypothetical protein
VHVRRQLDLRVAGVDAAEEARAGHDLVVQQLHAVHHVGAAALGRDGLAAGGFSLCGDGADLRGDFVHGGFEDELASCVCEVGFCDAGVDLGNEAMVLRRRCRCVWRLSINRGGNVVVWPVGSQVHSVRDIFRSALLVGVSVGLAASTESRVAALGMRVADILALEACQDLAGIRRACWADAGCVADDIAALAVVVLSTGDGATVGSLVAVAVLLLRSALLLLLLVLVLVLVLVLLLILILLLLVLVLFLVITVLALLVLDEVVAIGTSAW